LPTSNSRLARPGNTLILFFSTVGGLGYLPVMPGTFGSLAGLAVFLLVRGDVRWLAPALAVTLFAGFLLTGRAERLFGKKDSSHIVLDEVAGMLLSLLFIPPDLALALIGFLMFRIFDTLKPFPAGRLQYLKGSAGIMLDDVIAGLYANLVMQFIIRFI
jgi:phosphatidylglycerophosphatase A